MHYQGLSGSPRWTWLAGITRYLLQNKTGQRLPSARPLGYSNSTGWPFQRLMERMFGAQHCQSLLLYLDDIIVFSSSIEDHIHHLDLVLSRLRKEGLKAKLEKCCFFQKEVQYLGHLVSREGVSTDPAKVSAVAKWSHPTTVSELRSFLGFAGYYRRFVEGFSKLAAP